MTDISELHQRNQTLMRMLQEEQACAPLASPRTLQCSATRCAAQQCAQNGGADPIARRPSRERENVGGSRAESVETVPETTAGTGRATGA